MIFIHIFGECPVKLRKSEIDTGRIHDPNGWIHWKYCSLAKEGLSAGVRPEAAKGESARHLGIVSFSWCQLLEDDWIGCFWKMIGLAVGLKWFRALFWGEVHSAKRQRTGWPGTDCLRAPWVQGAKPQSAVVTEVSWNDFATMFLCPRKPQEIEWL